MSDKIGKGRFIVVEWKSKDDINEERLETFIKGNMPNETIKVMKNPEKPLAQVEFTSEQDPEYLKTLWSRRQFWEITNIYAKEESCRIKVENIPSTAEIRDIYRYFTNAKNVTMKLTDVEVEERFFCPKDGRCVVRLSSAQDVKAICARRKDFAPYRDFRFLISPFYEELNPSNDEISNKYFYVDPITVADVDGTKLMYLKDFCSKMIDDKLSGKCGKIKWCDPGIKKVEIIFDCSHENDKRRHSEEWRRDVKTIFLNILGKVRTIRKTIPGSTWNQVIGVLEQNNGDIWVDEDEKKHILVLVGLNDDDVLKTMVLEIEQLVKPKPVVDKKIHVDVKDKLDAFVCLELQDYIAGVDIDIEIKPRLIKIHGEETQVKEAETSVLELLNHIVFCETDLAVDGFSSILCSQLIQDKINAEKESNGWRCGFLIDGNKLKIFAIDPTVLNGFKDLIMAQLSEQDVRYEGRVDTHSNLRENVQKIEKEYSPYVKLSVNIQNREVIIHIVSTTSHVNCIVDELNENIDAHLIKEEIVPMGPSVFKYIQEKSFPDLNSKLAQLKLKIGDVLKINKEKSVITVVGNKEMRNKVIPVVTKLARAIRSHWAYIEREGIHNYMLDGKGNSIIEKINAVKSCQIRWVTQYEMLAYDINCIVPLKTGQSIFLCNGSLTCPGYSIDAIVIAANKKLQHERHLALQLVSKGGQLIEKDCKNHMQRQGHNLNDGDVFIGSPGKLRCQRVIHVVEPETNDPKMVAKMMINIMTEIDKEKNYVLRTFAMPIISAGFEVAKAAKILLQAIKDKLKDFPNVREIYFYETNQSVIKTIQKRMQLVFGDSCFHMPTNVSMKAATMTSFRKSQFLKQRNGERVIPLPRNKSFVIQWGDIAKTKATVVVSPTPTAPNPTGKILDVLKTGAGISCNLVEQCINNFKSNYQNVPDGGIAESNGGRLPCDKIYHLKIDGRWKTQSHKNLEYCINKCLERAVRNDVKEIAFPTIGTADCKYPPNEVARVFFRTVAKFVTLRPTCSLEKIIVVAYSADLSTIMAFDGVLEEMYSRRFHRLMADIEEETTEEETASQPKKDNGRLRPPSAIRRQPTVLINPGKTSSQSNLSFNIGLSSKQTVHLEVGQIQDAKADAIVCSTSSFPKLNGQVANAIKRKAGNVIEDECKKKYNNYPSSGVAVTKGGQLQCKEVIYIVLQDYKPNANEKSIYEAVRNCLEQAENDQCASLAIPILGTGGFKYPANISASKTFAAINDFFKSPRHNLTDVTIVMYGGDNAGIQAYRAEASSNSAFSPIAVPSGRKSVDKSPVSHASSNDQKWKVPNSSIFLEITHGNLGYAKADVILDTTTSFPKLNGAIPNELRNIAGPELQEACTNYKGSNISGMIVETDGFKLGCKKVYHYLMPNWQETDGEQTIERCIEDCLHKMKNGHLSSIAVPSIGTGGAKYNPTKVARGIYRAVQLFGNTYPSVKCHVNVVLFPSADKINQIFEHELQHFIRKDPNNPKQAQAPAKKGVRFADGSEGQDDEEGDEENVIIPKGRKNFVLFQIVSDNHQYAEGVCKDITTQIDNEIKRSVVKLGKESFIEDVKLLKGKSWEKVVEFGKGYNVKVELKANDNEIVIKGFGESVMDCYQRILNYIKELRDVERNKGIGKIVYQHIEWYYKEDSGKIWVPYPKYLMYVLEDAFLKQEKRKEFRDNDDKMYVADFNTMVEYEKCDDKALQKKTEVGMIRKDFTEGALKSLPEHWEAMDKDENLKDVKLQHSDAEYQKVESAFNTTKGQSLQVVEIWRIQNRVLYQQYRTTKEQLEYTRKGVTTNVEKNLWHGTNEAVYKSIISNGFNRSYSGKTHGDVWYGHGVYFAVQAKYSLSDNYAPVDGNGRKRIFYARVLTGQTTRVDKGYQERFPPLIPGSQIDRYDSTCDDVVNPEEYVIFKDTQAYPEYIVYCN